MKHRKGCKCVDCEDADTWGLVDTLLDAAQDRLRAELKVQVDHEAERQKEWRTRFVYQPEGVQQWWGP